MILVDAVYTNHSGSQRLLEYFIATVAENGTLGDYYFLLDSRLKSDAIAKLKPGQFEYGGSGETGRKIFYQKIPSGIDSVFCFGSVPPPLKISDRKVLILQHNPFFFENPGFNIKAKIVYWLKRMYIRTKSDDHYQWLVQTPRLKAILIQMLGVREQRVIVKPFYQADFFESGLQHSNELRFVYPADGVPQKNHVFLFRVWEKLFKKHGLLPELHLTIPLTFAHHLKEVDRLRQMGLKITNHGFVAKSKVKELYSENNFLIFPSLSESFGLPLVEAVNAGLKVIGSDLPFLHQIVQPSAVFDPHDEQALCDVIMMISNGNVLPETVVLVKNHIHEVIQLVQPTMRIDG